MAEMEEEEIDEEQWPEEMMDAEEKMNVTMEAVEEPVITKKVDVRSET